MDTFSLAHLHYWPCFLQLVIDARQVPYPGWFPRHQKSRIVFHYKTARYFAAQFLTKYSAFSLKPNNQNLQQEKFPFVKHNLVFIIIQTKEININGGYFTNKDIYYIITRKEITSFFNFTARVPE